MKTFEDKVRERAYFKYLNRLNSHFPGEPGQDWQEAKMEQEIEEKIAKEAYLHYLKNGDYPLLNWLIAEKEITQRLRFLAFYLHEADINKSPLENWLEAQKLYLEKF